jgi:glycosyltransferase involved in cell wall biosynthesis
MKILFIAQRIGLATKDFTGQDVKDQTWVATFLEKLQADDPELEIGHCFQTTEVYPRKRQVKGIVYYPMLVDNSKIKRWLNRILGRIPKLEALKSIQKAVEDFCPDVIHIFGTEKPYGLLEIKKNIPVIIQIQGLLNSIFPVYSGSISKIKLFLAAGIINLFKGGYLFDYLGMKKAAKNENLIFKRAKHVIGTTQFDESYLRSKNLTANYYKLNLILREEFYKANWDDNDTPVIVTISNEYTYKGFEIILRTATFLASMGAEFRWKVIGISKNGLFVSIYKKIFRNIQVWERIELLGTLNTDGIIQALITSGLYVNPSNIENAPLSLCEAMMVGMPVITSDAGGAKYLVNNGVDGLIFKTGDHNALAARVRELFNDRELATKLGRNAKKTAMIRHDPVEIIKRYKELLNKFIEI